MIYRTSLRGTYRNINSNLDLLSYRINKLTNQIASEKRVNAPSDDPTASATILKTRNIIADIQQYKETGSLADSWLRNSGNAAQSIKETLDKIFEKTEQGSTDTYNKEQRNIISNEINKLFDSIIQFGDSKVGDNYLFSGRKTNTRPFNLDMRQYQVQPSKNNSSLWTGQVKGHDEAKFNPRPDLPQNSQKFLMEVVKPGGIDSQLYARNNGLGKLQYNGNNSAGSYQLTLDAKDKQYNNTQIRLVPGTANINSTGTVADNNGLKFSGGPNPAKIIYRLGSSSQASNAIANWDSSKGTLTIDLKTDANNKSIAAANDVKTAVAGAGSPITCADLGSSNGTGLINTPGQFSYNNNTSVKVDGDTITVYLERDNQANGGAIKATVNDVAAAINSDPKASLMVNATATGSGATQTVQSDVNYRGLNAGQPYTLAKAVVKPEGKHNNVLFSIINNQSGPIGEAGNNYGVEYVYSMPPSSSHATTASFSGNTLTINLANSAALYNAEYNKAYYDSTSPAYLSASVATAIAQEKSVVSTAADVISAANSLSATSFISARPEEGNSGLGLVTKMSKVNFSQGYDEAAVIRVSQDGGKTWGPPQSFSPSEYKDANNFYNSQLGHASFTTQLPGEANDLVFTANQPGNWGNDLRVEYRIKESSPHPQTMEVKTGPNPWNICVYLETDSNGKIISTANDVMNAINQDSLAGQLVTASLATYSQDGQGTVTLMDVKSLKIDEPFAHDGRTIITPLGHAKADIKFPYKAPDQSDPNLMFHSLKPGSDGNKLGIRYTTSADPTLTSSAGNQSHQDFLSLRYEQTSAGTVMVVHLATTELPSCPDEKTDPKAAASWKKNWPVYSCKSSRAVTSTAGDLMQALMKKNTDNPESALIWGSMEKWPDGWQSNAKLGPVETVWLAGGNEQKAADHGINMQFKADGSAMQKGDIFEIPVGWYNGDNKEIDVNARWDYQTGMNIRGNQLLGNNGDEDNVLDMIKRITWALEKNNNDLVAKELPNLKKAIEKVTTMETHTGANMIRNQFVAKNLEQINYTSENTLSQIEDADFSKLVSDLKNAQTVYEACLGVTGLTTRLKLLDFIR